jgi:hypothetical protein
MLVKLAAASTQSEKDAARRTLDHMPRPGVNDALIRLLESADAPNRQAVLASLVARRVDAALPVLVKLMNGSDVSAAVDAVKALEALGTTAHLPALASILVNTAEPSLRAAAENTAAFLCTAAADRQACSQAILPALDKARSVPARISLIKLLPRVKTDQALAAVRHAIPDRDTDVRDAAVRTLTDWPDFSAVPHLLDLATTTDNDKHAILALQGCLRLAALKDRSLSQRLDVYVKVLAAAKRADEKKRALAGLADLPTLESLDLLDKLTADPALGSDATLAAIRLSRQLASAYNERALAVLQRIKAQTTSEPLLKQIDDAIKVVQSGGQSDGYIVAWLVSGPYTKEGKDGPALFDTAFDPEKPAAKVEWRPLTVAAADPKAPRIVELDKIIGGDDRVAYLLTRLTSEKPQEILLELGSDDGVKAWLNDKLIHSNNATRPCNPGSDKVKATLRQGLNTLMLKITQGGGEWAACVRLRSANGGDPDGVIVSAPPAN